MFRSGMDCNCISPISIRARLSVLAAICFTASLRGPMPVQSDRPTHSSVQFNVPNYTPDSQPILLPICPGAIIKSSSLSIVIERSSAHNTSVLLNLFDLVRGGFRLCEQTSPRRRNCFAKQVPSRHPRDGIYKTRFAKWSAIDEKPPCLRPNVETRQNYTYGYRRGSIKTRVTRAWRQICKL